MHSSLILTLSFASMCGYLNWATQQTTEPVASTAGLTQVSRVILSGAQDKPSATEAEPQAFANLTEPAYKLPLDLTIPSSIVDNNDSETLSTATSKGNWFESTQTNKVQYGAQLLFDAEEGTTIRGGQVNIIIPMG